jgi:hypothetical protein
VIALLTDARADRVEGAIDKTGAFRYVDVLINNVGAAIPEIEETGVQELAA